MFSSRSRETVALTSPSPAKASASFRSSRPPTTVLLRLAEALPAGPTVIAVSVGGVQPRDSHRVALLHVRHAGPHGGDVPRPLVARDEGQLRLDGPVAVFLLEGLVRTRHLLVERFDNARQEAEQSELSPLVLGERGALV